MIICAHFEYMIIYLISLLAFTLYGDTSYVALEI